MSHFRYYYGKPIYKEVRISGESHYTLKLKYMGQITVAGYFDSTKNLLYLGYSRCHSEDNFSKRLGKQLAEKRAMQLTTYVPCFPGQVAPAIKKYYQLLEEKIINNMR